MATAGISQIVSRSRVEVFGALAATVTAVIFAVASGLASGTATSGVAAADATRLHTVTHDVRIDGSTITVTSKPSGSVCFKAPAASGCASRLTDAQLSYDTGRSGKRIVLAGIAGPGVKAVIARLTHKGTVWPTLRKGAFYAVLPRGYKLTSIVKVLAGGRRVAFKA